MAERILFSGMPVDWGNLRAKMGDKYCQRLVEKYGLAEGSPRYQDSSRADCELCGDAFWLGPRSRLKAEALKQEGHDLELVCIVCVPHDSTVYSLGNDSHKLN